MTKAAFARHLRVSDARVSQYCRAGMPTYYDGTVNVERAERWLRKRFPPVSNNRYRDRGPMLLYYRELAEAEAAEDEDNVVG